MGFFNSAAPAHPCARGIGASCPAQSKKFDFCFAPFSKHLHPCLKNGGTSIYRTQAVENEIFNSLLKGAEESISYKLNGSPLRPLR
ncbi:MAG: hypothetical protein M1283_04400 [Gammaproteobacteria bacterium]|nr:hypothetical protein [Gammaproteobacteria bacterium]